MQWKITLIGLTLAGLLIGAPALQAQPKDPVGTLSLQSFPAIADLKLSAAQQEQALAIIQDVRQQIQFVLTPAQRDQFRSSLDQGKSMREAAMTLTLSADQQQQLRQILQSTRPKIEAILTPEQQQQMSQKLRSLRKP